MRCIAVILSFLILAFSTTACSDEPPVHAEDSHYALTEAGADHPEHTDFCSPLCACGCCAAHVILAKGYYIPAITSHAARVYADISAGRPSDVSPAVWQPPQA